MDSARRSLGDRVEDARRRAFVGRRAELALFADVLAGSGLVHVSGEGGVGKTTLVREWIALAREAGRTVVHLDGRDVDATPAGFEEAVRRACGVEDARDPFDDLTEPVLVVDGFEHLAALERWLRESYLPFLPSDAVVVLAGRTPPDRAWTTDPGWRDVLRSVRLDPLAADDSAALLAVWGVADPAVQDHLATLGHGHPLALTLLALTARAATPPPTLSSAPEVVTELLHTFVDEVPDAALRRALLACAHSWLTTEDLLADVVGGDHAARAWAWLSGLSFVVRAPRGIYPHELARDVVDADFRRRSPEEYAEVHRAVRRHVVARIRRGGERERHEFALQLFFLHHDSPLAHPFWAMRAGGVGVPERLTTADEAGVEAVVALHRAEETLDLLRHWLGDPSCTCWVVRDADGIAAFKCDLLVDERARPAVDDLAVAAILDHVAREHPTRPGEKVLVSRFYGGRDGLRDPVSNVLNAVSSLDQWLAVPHASAWIVAPDPEFFLPLADYLAFDLRVDLPPSSGAPLAVGQDWRRLTREDWLELAGDRELTGATGPPPADLLRPVPLGADEFGRAVRALLADVSREDRLRLSPLSGSRLGAADPAERPDALRRALHGALAVLGAERRGDVLRSVIDRTYLRGAPTQEAAAEVLGLPFSTYRRHLTRAVERLTEILWAAELGEIELDGTARSGQELGTD